MVFYASNSREMEAPVNVRIMTSDGLEIPVDCRYLGRDRMGIHCWETIFPYYVDGDGYGLSLVCDKVPPRTRINAYVCGEIGGQ